MDKLNVFIKIKTEFETLIQTTFNQALGSNLVSLYASNAQKTAGRDNDIIRILYKKYYKYRGAHSIKLNTIEENERTYQKNKERFWRQESTTETIKGRKYTGQIYSHIF